MLKWIDLPPIWLLGFILVAWWASPGQSGALLALFGGGLVLAGLALMVWAVFEMARAKTTVIPHLHASALVTTGPFGFTRNPIYLGDALVLAGLLLRWQLWWALPLVAVFVWIITRRFILHEEQRLTEDFGSAFEEWCSKTRRWL
ncbi:MAG: isoprenylcysteine carboxylmethyltransferase family protein [Pseudomonadota bacterium]